MKARDQEKRIARLLKRMERMKAERHFLIGRYEQLKEEVRVPAERPRGQTLKCIPKKKLGLGRWYLGIGRGSNVAFWDGQQFLYFEEIMGEKVCNHWDDGPPYGCFQPFEEIDHRKYGRECQYVETTSHGNRGT